MSTDIGTITAKVNIEVQKIEDSIVKDEPVIVGHFALLLLSLIGEFLVGHHILGDAQWSADQNSVLPLVTIVLLAVSAWLLRRVVTPVAHLISTAATGLSAHPGIFGVLHDLEPIAGRVDDVVAPAVEKIEHVLGDISPVPAPDATAADPTVPAAEAPAAIPPPA